MSWLEKLYATYQQGVSLDLPDGDRLMPISHTVQNAHINIIIDGEGNFKSAETLEKTQIVLPATESSAGRSSGEAPHPLADKLQYVAKDYAQYGGLKKAYFEGYQNQLRKWCESEFSHPKAQAVYRYIEKGQVINDLIKVGIVHVDENNVLLTRWPFEVNSEQSLPTLFKILPKEKGKLDQGSALVCWTVELPGDANRETWKDQSLYQSWIDYYASLDAKEGLCYVSGENAPLSVNHQAKLRHSGDKAKLISSNDLSGFTYRGKFTDAEQACGISFEVTQKAHNALRWLISRKQAFRAGDQAVIAWSDSGKPTPKLMAATYEEFDDPEDLQEIEVNEGDMKLHAIDHRRDLGQSFAEKLKKKMNGYHAELGDLEKIIIMAIDSATPGRMAIAYYQESFAREYIERIETWHQQLAWPQRYTKPVVQPDGKKPKLVTIWPVSAPAPIAIAEAAYGKTIKENLKKKTIERLLACIVEGKSLPKDLVDACVRNASNPNAYEKDSKWLWLKNLSIACALYKGYHSERNPNIEQRRNYSMSLDRQCNRRDYLYGRLLAVAEKIERQALTDTDKGRITNAEGLMQRFSFNPFKTWEVIHKQLVPYRNRLRVSKPGLLWYWEKEIQEICDLFDQKDFVSDAPLSGEYLLGYYCQKNYKKPKKAKAGELIAPAETETETDFE